MQLLYCVLMSKIRAVDVISMTTSAFVLMFRVAMQSMQTGSWESQIHPAEGESSGGDVEMAKGLQLVADNLAGVFDPYQDAVDNEHENMDTPSPSQEALLRQIREKAADLREKVREKDEEVQKVKLERQQSTQEHEEKVAELSAQLEHEKERYSDDSNEFKDEDEYSDDEFDNVSN